MEPSGQRTGMVRGGQAQPSRGQAALEAAIVLPLTVVILLCLFQLGVLVAARLTTAYAAHAAVRAGVVWSGSGQRMHDAALLALLPTIGRTDDWSAWRRTRDRARRLDAHLHAELAPLVADRLPDMRFVERGLLGMVRVDLLSPTHAPAPLRLPATARGPWRELDFDAIGRRGEESLGGRGSSAMSEDEAAEALNQTRLSIRLRYLYELRIPIAAPLLFHAWTAARAFSTHEDDEGPGLPELHPSELERLRALARGSLLLEPPGDGPRRRYFIPLSATWRMRLQSNLHAGWRMHEGASR